MRRWCAEPFEKLEVGLGGAVYACCSGWLPVKLGVVGRGTSTLALFNSPAAKRVRASVLDGSFRYCARECPFLAAAPSGPVKLVDEVPAGYAEEMPHPRMLNLAHDRTCNLACPSCRSGFVRSDAEQLARDTAFQDAAATDEVLAGLEWLSVSGAGEVFISGPHRDLLRRLGSPSERYPHLKVRIQTNGLLFTERNLLALGEAWRRIKSVIVSVDAATAETYAKVRGGSWPLLLRNLGYIAGLRRAGQIERLQIAHVVQARNWREMGAMAEMGVSLGADEVSFVAIKDWVSMEDYPAHAVHLPRHSETTDFRRYLGQESRLRNPAVTLGSLALLGIYD